ncbi:Ig-like domain-containing protein [Cryobacterium roopkundense]|nr:Ig-like domain-containing protein [Cryobacterium roopkundense]
MLRRRSLATLGVLTSSSLVLTLVAFLYPGFTTADVELNDGGVWVTKPSGLLVGHLNYQSQVLDSGLRTKANDFDILQSGTTVITHDRANATLSLVDPANVVFGSEVHVPPAGSVALGATTVAILDQATGDVFISTVNDLTSFTLEGAEPAVSLGAGAAVAVGSDGAVRAVSARDKQIVTIETREEGGFGEPATTDLPALPDAAVVSIAAIGAESVVLDATSALLYLPGGTTVPAAAESILQQSGPASNAVLTATPTSLVTHPLDGSAAATTDSEGVTPGVPAAPVFLNGCAYAAWAGSARYVRDCPASADDVSRTVDSLQAKAAGELTFRVNRNVVVLNDLNSGLVWLVDQNMMLVDNWNEITPPSDQTDPDQQQDAVKETVENALPVRKEENTPPVAVDDDFGVRPGRSVILPVLENDSDADGDLLTASLLGESPGIGVVQPILGGTALQISVADDASGGATVRYQIDDGRGGTAEATVTLSVSAPGTNQPPVQKRTSTLVVEQGATVTRNVLSDWSDPDGDDLFLQGAASADDDVVQFAADGQVTYAAIGANIGRKNVSIVVSDGFEGVEGLLRADVRAAGSAKPLTNPDHATTVVGRTVTVSPLLNDESPSGAPLRLAKIDDVPGASVVPDFTAGTFTFTADAARTFYVQYLVTDGPNTVLGLVRIDVTDASPSALPPVAVRDVALLPTGGVVLVDVLQNDTDPAGGILVVQSLSIPDNLGISVSVLEHRILRVADQSGLAEPVSIRYTVSNGTLTAEGEVLVIPVPAPTKLMPPVAVDDSATVRVGDILTIDVLANDSHPNGDTISLSPTLVAPLVDPADGDLFISENTLRFKAGATAKTVYGTYEVIDSQGQKDAGYVTIQILAAADTNSAPRPTDLIARVLSGNSVRIPIPLDQIDPDGDSVELVGQGSAPTKGRIVEVGASWLEYEAYEASSGTDRFTYVVRDRNGARATATIQVGIAPPGSVNQKPYAVKDAVTARTARQLSVPVLVNDTDPDGDILTLEKDGLELPDGLVAKVVGDRILLETPRTEGEFSIRYTVSDPWGATAIGTLQLSITEAAPLRQPIARDDRVAVADIAGQDSVDVPVLVNDEDPDGSASALAVSVDDPAARVRPGGVVRVTLAGEAQIVVYTVTDADGLTAFAFILVPGRNDLRPTLTADVKPVQVKSGETVTLALDDYVTVADGKKPRITVASGVTATHANGDALIKDETTLVYTSAADYFGPDAISFEVTDGTGPDDPAGLTAVLSIPVTVLAPENQQPTFVGGTIEVAPGGDPVTADLQAMSQDVDPGDLKKLEFRLVGAVPAGFSLNVRGQTFEARVATNTPKGTAAAVSLEITDGTSEPITGSLQLKVVASTQPLATTTDDVVSEARQGQTSAVSVLANDISPFEGEALTVVAASVETGAGTASVRGSDVVVTPAGDFVGTMVVRYRVADVTRDVEREVDGRIRLTVQGKPDAPSTPTVTSIQDSTIVLSWNPPSNNGAVITSYTVRSANGLSTTCASTTCTLSGLTNDVEYTFTVTASNAVGESAASGASASARPDARPDAPQAPTLTFGDGSLAVSWDAPRSTGSPITSYTLEITPGGEQRNVTGTSTVWTGLENGTSYAVRVQAHNRAPEPSTFSVFSAGMVPAGVPDAPNAPTTSPATPVGDQAQISVSWNSPAANGDLVSEYTLSTMQNGAVVGTLPVSGTAATVVVAASDTDYTFAVTARNKAGESASSASSSPRRGAIPPGAPTNVLASPLDGAVGVSFTAGALNGNRSDEVSYRYRVDQTGSEGTIAAGGGTISGLSNGTGYSISVWAISSVEGVSPGAETSSGAVIPFGSPIITLQAINRQDNAVQFVWNVNGNGRVITGGDPGIDGNGNGAVTNSGLQPSQTTSLTVQYTNEGGLSASATWSGQANDAPPAFASATQGSSIGGNVYELNLNTSNFPAGSYIVKCFTDEDGQLTAKQMDVPANGTITPCTILWRTGWVYIEVVGAYTTEKLYIP